jgi:hypothetical protein
VPRRERTPSGFEPPYPAGWFDRLLDWIDRAPVPNWLCFTGLMVLLLVYMTGMLWWNGRLPVGSIDPSRVFIVVVTPYLLWVRFHLDQVACAALDDFRSSLAVDDRELMRLRYELTTLSARTTWLVTVACLVVAVANWLIMPESLLDPYAGSRARALVAFGPVAVSTLVVVGVTTVHALHQLGMVQQLHDRVATIRLLRTKPLYAFSGLTARTGASMLLFVYFVAAVRPDLVFGSPSMKAVFAAIVPTAIGCFVLPLRGIHRRIAAEKERALAETAGRIEAVLARLHERVDQANIADADKLNMQLSGLVTERDLLDRVSTWPWEPATLTGFVTTLVLPALVWALQRVVERMGF